MDSAEEEGVIRVGEEDGHGGLRRPRRVATKPVKYVDPLTDDDEDERPKRKGKKGGNRARKKTANEDEEMQKNEIDEGVMVEDANGKKEAYAKTNGNTDSISEEVEDSGSKLSIATRTRKRTKKKDEIDGEVPTKSSKRPRKTVNKDNEVSDFSV